MKRLLRLPFALELLLCSGCSYKELDEGADGQYLGRTGLCGGFPLLENSRELKEIGESFSALKRYTVLSGQENVEDAVIEQGECPYTLKDARAFSSIYDVR